MAEYKRQLDLAMGRLERLRGMGAIEELRGIVELAMGHHDVNLVADAISQQIKVAKDNDLFQPQLVALTQLRDLYTGDSRFAFARDQVLWYHKWVIEPLAEQADVPAEIIEGMIAKFEGFLRAEGIGLRPVHMLRFRSAWIMGRMEEARGHLAKWQETPRGRSDDCAACELNCQIEFLLSANEPEKVLELAQPLFRGELRCEEVPAITFSRMLMLALREEEPRLAEAMFLSTRRVVRKKRDLVSSLGRQIFYLAATGRGVLARRMAAIALARAPGTYDYNRFVVYLSCAFWFTALVREGVMAVKLPAAFELAALERSVSTAEGAAWCFEQSRGLAERLDRRNGNSYYGERVRDMGVMCQSVLEVEEEE